MKTINAFSFFFVMRAIFNMKVANISEFNVNLNIFFWVAFGIFLIWILLLSLNKEGNRFTVATIIIFISTIIFEIFLHLSSIGMDYSTYIKRINNPLQDEIMLGGVALVVITLNLMRLWPRLRESLKE